MEIPPGLRNILDKLGVNTTRLQWRLYEWERKREQKKERGGQLPSWLQWMNYPHKFCFKCNAINDRQDKTCHNCGARLPSMTTYRIFRLIGVVIPKTGAPVVTAFIMACAIVFLGTILMQGTSAIMAPKGWTLFAFGSYRPALTWNYYPELGISGWHLWRMFGFALVHGGLIHIGFNLFVLFQIGPIMEANIGPKRMLPVITVTQFTSAIATYIWYQGPAGNIATVGASGFLFGLIGFGIAYFGRMGGSGEMLRAHLIRWAIYAFVFGLIIGANNAAHAGGFIGGFLIGQIPMETARRARNTEGLWNLAAAISALIWAVTVAMLIHSIITAWSPGGETPERFSLLLLQPGIFA